MALSQAQLIDVLRRTCDTTWLEGLLQDPNSAAILNAIAAEWERVSLASDANCNAGLISLAPGGHPGRSSIKMTRPSGVAPGGGVLPKGTRFRDARGLEYVTSMLVVVPVGALTIDVPIESVRKNELVNSVDDPVFEPVNPLVFAATVTGASHPASPIVITTLQPHGLVTGAQVTIAGVTGNLGANGTWVVTVLTGTTFSLNGSTSTGAYTGLGVVVLFDPAFIVTGGDPVTAGASDFLSAHGRERGQLRQPFETEDAYRARVRNIPDMVSPAALIAAATGMAQQYLPEVTLFEPFAYGPVLQITAATNPASPIVITVVPDSTGTHGLTTGQFVRIKGVLGNTAANGLWQITVLSNTTFSLNGSTANGAYTSGGLAALATESLDYLDSLFFNPGGVIPPISDFLDDASDNFLGRREACAYVLARTDTVPQEPNSEVFYLDASFLDDSVFGFTDEPFNPALLSGLLSITEELGRKRAACVQVDLELAGVVTVGMTLNPDDTGNGSTALAAVITVFTLKPPTGIVWHYVDGFIGHTPDPTGASHQVRFTFEDSSTLSTALDSGFDSEFVPRSVLGPGPIQRIKQIEGRVISDGVTTVTANGAFRVVEQTA